MYVRVKQVKVSAVKNKYYIKNTAAHSLVAVPNTAYSSEDDKVVPKRVADCHVTEQ